MREEIEVISEMGSITFATVKKVTFVLSDQWRALT